MECGTKVVELVSRCLVVIRFERVCGTCTHVYLEWVIGRAVANRFLLLAKGWKVKT